MQVADVSVCRGDVPQPVFISPPVSGYYVYTQDTGGTRVVLGPARTIQTYYAAAYLSTSDCPGPRTPFLITVRPKPDTGIFLAGPQVLNLADSTSGNQYTWLRNNTPFAGANSYRLLVTTSGNYQGIIENTALCRDTTRAITVTVTAGTPRIYTAPNLYPNPTAALLFVDGLKAGTPYRIQDMAGKCLQKGILTRQTINVETLPKGLYTLRLEGFAPTTFTKE